MLIAKTAQDIEKLCDDENQRHDLVKITEGFKILTDETVNEYGQNIPSYIIDQLATIAENKFKTITFSDNKN